MRSSSITAAASPTGATFIDRGYFTSLNRRSIGPISITTALRFGHRLFVSKLCLRAGSFFLFLFRVRESDPHQAIFGRCLEEHRYGFFVVSHPNNQLLLQRLEQRLV